ncbi:hypothetical protein V6N11_069872 [Hibiscus sabdariffa]|uniref:Uncharacterized protein n=1 Tax=Hibiscus sabdariffa TaxID=183260 RepID=A0ABR2Q428_9ROSI
MIREFLPEEPQISSRLPQLLPMHLCLCIIGRFPCFLQTFVCLQGATGSPLFDDTSHACYLYVLAWPPSMDLLPMYPQFFSGCALRHESIP